MIKLNVFDPKKRKLVLCGMTVGNTLFREVSRKHFMRVVDGYGIQKEAFDIFREKGIERIILTEKETGKKWESKVENWRIFGRLNDYGHGKQWFLSLKYMQAYTRPEPDWDKIEAREQSIIDAKKKR